MGSEAGIRDWGFGIRLRHSRVLYEGASLDCDGRKQRSSHFDAPSLIHEVSPSVEGWRPGLPSPDDGACIQACLPALSNPDRAQRRRRLRSSRCREATEPRIPNPGSSIPNPESQIPRAQRVQGFTLLEVLIALLILSLVLVALIRTAGLQAGALAHQRDSTLAQWVAANVVAELRATGAPPVGRQRGGERMGEQRWRWQADTSDTDVPGLRRMEIEVFEIGEADAIAEPDGDPVARLTAFATP